MRKAGIEEFIEWLGKSETVSFLSDSQRFHVGNFLLYPLGHFLDAISPVNPRTLRIPKSEMRPRRPAGNGRKKSRGQKSPAESF
jgi:hypothetical protein